MKKSRYTYIFDVDDRKVAFNSMTCAMAEIDEDFVDLFNKIEEITMDDLNDQENELVNDMMRGWFIVPDAVNELDEIKYRNYSGKYAKEHLSLVIAPTLLCNFACPYCYEHPKSGVISQEIQDRLAEMVRDNAERKRSVDITWYGGEPLLAKECVFGLSRRFMDICEENGVPYNASMVTNGFLVLAEDMKRFQEYHISQIQITIDGTEETHNKRRFQKDKPEEGTFAKIVENVKSLHDEGFDLTIRINIDRTNIDDTKNLILYLKERNILNSQIVFGHVAANTDANRGIKDTCLTMPEYSEAVIDLQEFLIVHGLRGSEAPFYPGIKRNYCGADAINTFVIDHEGYMYKCWNEVGDIACSVGNIMWPEDDYSAEMKSRDTSYLTWSPFENEGCKECKILPICMGGCPYVGLKRGHKQCERWKFGLLKALKKMFKQGIEADV